MKEVHDFTTPRNLYEKLIRDSERLDTEVNGDNLFNFLATAHQLKAWIKNSPMARHETIKRMLRKASGDENMKNCTAILEGKKHFVIGFGENYSNPVLIIAEQKYDPLEFKNNILGIFEVYFSSK